MTWVAAADYRRGAKEERPGQPCRAFGQVIRLGGEALVGAVADGAEDAALSHHGAKVAVRAALAGISRLPDAVPKAVTDPTRQSAETMFRSVVAEVDHALRDAAARHNARTRDLETSLVVFAVTHQGTIAARVGNGMVVTRGPDKDYVPLFFSRDRSRDRAGKSALDLHALAESEIEVAQAEGPLSFICAATDALRALTSRRISRGPRRQFLSRLDYCATTAPSDSYVHQEIRSLLRSARVAPRIKDDLGVALCGYHPQGDLFDAVPG